MSEFRNEGFTAIVLMNSVEIARRLSKSLTLYSRARWIFPTGLTETSSMRKLTGKKFVIVVKGLPFAGLGMRRFKDISCLITQPGEVARFVY